MLKKKGLEIKAGEKKIRQLSGGKKLKRFLRLHRFENSKLTEREPRKTAKARKKKGEGGKRERELSECMGSFQWSSVRASSQRGGERTHEKGGKKKERREQERRVWCEGRGERGNVGKGK